MNSNLEKIISLANVVDGQISDLEAKLASIPPPSPRLAIGVLDELQTLTGTTENTGWIQPGNVGNSPGSETKPHGTFTFTPGKTATFTTQPAAPYDNYYWYTKRMGFETANRFLLDLTIGFPDAGSLLASQGIEFEIQHSFNGLLFDMAWQIQHPATGGNLRSFDKVNRKWVDTGLTLPAAIWANAAMVPFTASFIQGDSELSYVGLAVAGKQVMTTPIIQQAKADVQKNYLAVAYQMDTNSTGKGYTTKVSGMRVTWCGGS
jgi:hypothetical protein